MTPAFFAGVIQGASWAHRYVIWHYVTLRDAIAKKTTRPKYLAHNHDRQVGQSKLLPGDETAQKGNYPKRKVSTFTNIYHAE